jgi:hypothetical protein
MAGVHRAQEAHYLVGLTALADDDPVGAHAHRVADKVAELDILVGDFNPRDGVPEFEMVPLFLRAKEGPHSSVEFDLPMLSKGYGALADRGAHIADRMKSAGVSDEELRSWLDPRDTLPPVEPV